MHLWITVLVFMLFFGFYCAKLAIESIKEKKLSDQNQTLLKSQIKHLEGYLFFLREICIHKEHYSIEIIKKEIMMETNDLINRSANNEENYIRKQKIYQLLFIHDRLTQTDDFDLSILKTEIAKIENKLKRLRADVLI